MNKKVIIPIVIVSVALLFIIVASVSIILFIKNNRYIIMSGISMEPTIKDKEKIRIRNKDVINRYDIVAYKGETSMLVKRVYGLPYDKVEIKGSKLLINGEEISYDKAKGRLEGYAYYELSKDEYFVMGDNLENSLDSRQIGPISKNQIKGVMVDD